MATLSELLTRALQVYNEQVENMNSNVRIGSLLRDIVNFIDTKQGKESGKGLSTNDFSNVDKANLATLVNLLNDNPDNVLNTISEVFKVLESYPEGVKVVDLLGAKLDKGGFTGTAKTLESRIDDLDSSKLSNSNVNEGHSDGHYFVDEQGNVMAKVTPEGIQATAFIDKDGNDITANSSGNSGTSTKKLDGKFVVSLGDSHMNQPWLPAFCTATGASYSSTIQQYLIDHKPDYYDTGHMMGYAKALKEYCSENNKIVDLILIENTHFIKPSTDFNTFVPQDYQNFKLFPTTYASLQSYYATQAADLAAYKATLVPTLKTVIRVNYNTYKTTVSFTSAGTLTAGTVTLTINGQNFAVNVTNGETLVQAVTALNDWAFNEYVANWTNWTTKGQTRTSGTIELIYTGANAAVQPTITFNAGSTGLIMSDVSMTNTTNIIDWYFNSYDLTKWSDATYWVLSQGGSSLYACMKGLVEFLQENFKNTKLVIWTPPNFNISLVPSASNSYLVESYPGSGIYYFDINAFYANTSNANIFTSYEGLKIFADLMRIRIIELHKLTKLNYYNLFPTYYSQNNVHPLAAGYALWGNELADLY
ncbi:MAG: hypothetical protein BGN96_12190 [Bacteroidales bacterium 45-6]|nr:MAG: hypothetical protein BGN96_12190 [Bacteroidales bacterium 45-6]